MRGKKIDRKRCALDSPRENFEVSPKHSIKDCTMFGELLQNHNTAFGGWAVFAKRRKRKKREV